MNLEFCAELFTPFRNGQLFVGFSGGADSTAVLLLAAELRSRFGFDLTAVHFDHGLRPESAREADMARQFAEALDVEFRLIPLALHPGPNLEARARDARLRCWRELAGCRTKCAVLLGHHRDDRLENLFLRLARGSNSSGLTGMQKYSMVDGVRFLRPLINSSRSEIENFLRERGVDQWIHDASNGSTDFERNFLRNKLLREWFERSSAARAGCLHSLDVLELDAQFLESEAEKRYRAIAETAETPLEFWQKLEPAMLPRVLRFYLSDRFDCSVLPTAAMIERLKSAWRSTSPEKRLIDLGGNIFLELRGNRLRPCRSAMPAQPDRVWRWRSEPRVEWNDYLLLFSLEDRLPDHFSLETACFDADRLPELLRLTPRHPGDKIVPFGRSTPVSLKKLRVDRKLPAEFAAPVLRDGRSGEILWAPGIRHSAAAPVSEKTRRVAVFRCFAEETLSRNAPPPPVPAPPGTADAQC